LAGSAADSGRTAASATAEASRVVRRDMGDAFR